MRNNDPFLGTTCITDIVLRKKINHYSALNKIFSDILLAGISIYTFWQFLVLSSVYIGQCTHLTVIHFFSTVRCVHWIMYTLDSNKIDFTVCSDINGWRLTGAIADLFFTKYNGNIVGVTRVHWRIYSLGVEQYIPRRFAPLDILHNPSGVYSPMYPCHAHYIITLIILGCWWL